MISSTFSAVGKTFAISAGTSSSGEHSWKLERLSSQEISRSSFNYTYCLFPEHQVYRKKLVLAKPLEEYLRPP